MSRTLVAFLLGIFVMLSLGFFKRLFYLLLIVGVLLFAANKIKNEVAIYNIESQKQKIENNKLREQDVEKAREVAKNVCIIQEQSTMVTWDFSHGDSTSLYVVCKNGTYHSPTFIKSVED